MYDEDGIRHICRFGRNDDSNIPIVVQNKPGKNEL
jgi:hypothetical protein